MTVAWSPILLALPLMVGCSSGAALSGLPINHSGNRALRRDLIELGVSSVCAEVLKETVPIRLGVDDPALGRFFPRTCKSDTLAPAKDLYIQVEGVGYATTNLTDRVGFKASIAVQYSQDFRQDGGKIYAYLRPVAITSNTLEPLMVEAGALGSSALRSALGTDSPAEFVGRVGSGLLAYELMRGLTVIDDGSRRVIRTGVLAVGSEPIVPFHVTGSRDVLENDRLEIQPGQREFLGPYEVSSEGQAFYVTAELEAAPNVDLLVVPRAVGETWLTEHVTKPGAAPLPMAPVHDETIPAGRFRRRVRVPKGSYFVVIDQTSTAGRSAPSVSPDDKRAALVNLALELGSE